MIPKYFNTRFNPTPTGDMHIGHVYLCLVNCYEAMSNGGQFFVRFDDTQLYWQYRIGQHEMVRYAHRTLEDLEWLCIPMDGYRLQSQIQEEAYSELERMYGIKLPEERMGYSDIPYVKGLNCMPMPYTSALTAEKVWFDWMDYCDYIIRGVDLITEYALYSYWVDKLRLHHVRHVFLPRLSIGGDDPSYSSSGEHNTSSGFSVSKTDGGYTVREFREKGWSKDELLSALKVSCLKDPGGVWSIDNVKDEPMWLDLPYAEELEQHGC